MTQMGTKDHGMPRQAYRAAHLKLQQSTILNNNTQHHIKGQCTTSHHATHHTPQTAKQHTATQHNTPQHITPNHTTPNQTIPQHSTATHRSYIYKNTTDCGRPYDTRCMHKQSAALKMHVYSQNFNTIAAAYQNFYESLMPVKTTWRINFAPGCLSIQ